jgi:hypothetical protein
MIYCLRVPELLLSIRYRVSLNRCLEWIMTRTHFCRCLEPGSGITPDVPQAAEVNQQRPGEKCVPAKATSTASDSHRYTHLSTNAPLGCTAAVWCRSRTDGCAIIPPSAAPWDLASGAKPPRGVA